MVLPIIRSVEEIDCLSFFDENKDDLYKSRKTFNIHRNHLKTVKIKKTRIISKRLKSRGNKLNYPIAS